MNLLANGGFEVNTAGWSTLGASITLVRSTAQAKYGAASLLVTTTAAAQVVLGGFVSIATLLPGRAYQLSAWVYVPSGWDGGDIEFRDESMTLTGKVVEAEFRADGAVTDVWQRFGMTLRLAADAVGNIPFGTTSAPSSGKTIYFDGVEVEEVPHPMRIGALR